MELSLTRTPTIEQLEGFKLKFKQRSHSPLGMPKFDHLSASRILHAPEETSIILGEKGRKRFDPIYSHPQEYRAAKRPITPPSRNNDVPRGKRYIPHPQRNDDHTSSKKILLTAALRRSESSNLPSVNWKTKGSVVDENGISAKDKESQIYNLEATMNRKQRVSGELDKRNGIAVATLGDKPLKKAEQTPGYYAEGGLIPGSTIQERKVTNPLAGKSNVHMASTGKLEATFGAMQQRLALEYDRAQVASLTIAGSKQGQYVPSWEERTGCFLVAPEDEQF